MVDCTTRTAVQYLFCTQQCFVGDDTANIQIARIQLSMLRNS